MARYTALKPRHIRRVYWRTPEMGKPAPAATRAGSMRWAPVAQLDKSGSLLSSGGGLEFHREHHNSGLRITIYIHFKNIAFECQQHTHSYRTRPLNWPYVRRVFLGRTCVVRAELTRQNAYATLPRCPSAPRDRDRIVRAFLDGAPINVVN